MFSLIAELLTSIGGGRSRRKRERHAEELRARGVLAPAIVVSAKKTGGKSGNDGTYIRIEYLVNVHPQNAAPFQNRFEHWSSRRGYTAVRGEIQGEAGRQIWVTYDPSNPSDMIFEYEESERAAIWAEAEYSRRRPAFVALAEPLEPLRTSGAPARVVINGVVDLQLPFPNAGSTAMEIHVTVTPEAGGGSYAAMIPALIGVNSLARYSAGRTLFARFDPADPSRVVFDSVRNKTLPD